MTLEQLEQERPLTVKIADAAAIMGVTPQFLRAALMQERFSFGVGVKMEQNEFYINTTRFIKYMKAIE